LFDCPFRLTSKPGIEKRNNFLDELRGAVLSDGVLQVSQEADGINFTDYNPRRGHFQPVDRRGGADLVSRYWVQNLTRAGSRWTMTGVQFRFQEGRAGDHYLTNFHSVKRASSKTLW
jgi:hypothetical protein